MIVSVHAQFECCPDDVGAPPGGHDFFACCDERRAHNRGVLTATGAAVALLEIADERVVLERKGEHRLKWKLERPCEILAQMTVDFVPAIGENFPRIEDIFGIEGSLNFTHYSEQLIA